MKGIVIDMKNDAGETPLMVACREGKTLVVNLLLSTYKTSLKVDEKSKDGWTALMYAAYNGYLSIFNALVKVGANMYTYDRV